MTSEIIGYVARFFCPTCGHVGDGRLWKCPECKADTVSLAVPVEKNSGITLTERGYWMDGAFYETKVYLPAQEKQI